MALLFAALKVFLISTIVLFTAIRFKEVCIINFIIKHMSFRWKFCLSCFKPRPPYLFLLFNSIIISISASTMFHHRSHPTPPSPPSAYMAKPMLLPEEDEEEEYPTLEDVWKGIIKGGKETTLQKYDTENEGRELNMVVSSTGIRPSPSLDELNQHVEAFIRKFKGEIRLQKLHSLSKSQTSRR